MDFQKKYGKILLPLITPYDENEEIDYGKYAELIEYVITNDLCDSLIVTGTTGEASLLTFDERVKLFETAVKASAGRKPVIAGTGCASTKETIALTNKAYDLGIELLLIVCPFYTSPRRKACICIIRRSPRTQRRTSCSITSPSSSASTSRRRPSAVWPPSPTSSA